MVHAIRIWKYGTRFPKSTFAKLDEIVDSITVVWDDLGTDPKVDAKLTGKQMSIIA
jgi:hypothetical protein